MNTKEQAQADEMLKARTEAFKVKSEWTPEPVCQQRVPVYLTIEERLHRIHVLALDLEIALNLDPQFPPMQLSEDEQRTILAELLHYTTTNTYATNSYRWETQ